MMISPEYYVEEHKNDTFDQLLQAKNELIEEIQRLETIVFDDQRTSDEWLIHPSPAVRYQMELEYLSEICKFIINKYNKEIVWNSTD